VKELLESQRGWRVCSEAATGREALKQAESEKPDLVVLDISMPDLNGLAVARQIHEVSPRSKLLVFSMHESEEVVREALDAGACGYVCKSDLDRDLLAAVEAVLSNKRFFGAKVTEIAVQDYINASGEPTGKRRLREGLTPRQHDVVRLLAEGKGNKEVASALGISVKTVETHRSAIMRRLELHSFSDLVRYAIRNHLVEA
jgi:DNA-binding NarL/FixJ family response regulator